MNGLRGCTCVRTGARVRGRDPLLEGATDDVPPQTGGVRAQAALPRAADQQDLAAVPEPSGRQREETEAAADGERLADQRNHQQVTIPLRHIVCMCV